MSKERLWYAEQVIEHGSSRVALEDWIKSKTYKQHGKAITNFAQLLPVPQSKLANGFRIQNAVFLSCLFKSPTACWTLK